MKKTNKPELKVEVIGSAEEAYKSLSKSLLCVPKIIVTLYYK